jgi:hypothetical protein
MLQHYQIKQTLKIIENLSFFNIDVSALPNQQINVFKLASSNATDCGSIHTVK